MLINKANSVFDHIQAIAATSSKKEKEALVKQGMFIPIFVKVVTYAYDRFKRYNIEFAPHKTAGIAPGANTLDEPGWWAMLDMIVAGELSGDRMREKMQQAIDLLDDKSSELFRRILMKDMRAGFTDGTINRVAPGTLAEFPYMRCALFSKVDTSDWPWAAGVISQEKADGMFVNVNKSDDGFTTITSRSGSPFPVGCMLGLEEAIQAMLKAGTQTHGELLVYEDGEAPEQREVLLPREIGNGILNSLLEGGSLESHQTVRMVVWDQIPLVHVKPKGKFSTGYKERLVNLAKQLRGSEFVSGAITLIPTKVVHSKADAFTHYRALLAQGKEGTILKHPDAIWKDGTSKEQLKLKLEVDVDLKIKGIMPGRMGTKNEGRAGSFTCETSCGGLLTDVTVKNEALRDLVDANPDDFIGRILAVRANAIMSPSDSNTLHSLFLPRMAETSYRTDKTEADSLQKVKDQFEAAIKA